MNVSPQSNARERVCGLNICILPKARPRAVFTASGATGEAVVTGMGDAVVTGIAGATGGLDADVVALGDTGTAGTVRICSVVDDGVVASGDLTDSGGGGVKFSTGRDADAALGLRSCVSLDALRRADSVATVDAVLCCAPPRFCNCSWRSLMMYLADARCLLLRFKANSNSRH